MSPSTDTIILQLYIEIDKLVEENKKLTDSLAKSEAERENIREKLSFIIGKLCAKIISSDAEVKTLRDATKHMKCMQGEGNTPCVVCCNQIKWRVEAEDRLAKAQDTLKLFPESEGIFDESSSEGMPVCKGLFFPYAKVEEWKTEMLKMLGDSDIPPKPKLGNSIVPNIYKDMFEKKGPCTFTRDMAKERIRKKVKS